MAAREACNHIVLVVDDDELIRETLCDFLGDEGYTVIGAGNGGEAMTELEHGARPCVILLDLMMPVMSGSEFYAAQHADPQLAMIPVVVMSADTQVEAKAASMGGRYLAKPMSLGTVIDTVERYC